MIAKEIITKLESLKNTDEKIEHSKTILNTKMEVLGIPNAKLRKIAKGINKNDYDNFLKSNVKSYYDFHAVQGYVLNELKDFNAFLEYLDIYSQKIDCWALSDLLVFNTKDYEKEFLDLSLIYTKKDLPFQRRVGLFILMKYLDEKHIKKVLSISDTFYKEDDYYVNMMNAWLLCEAFIKEREAVLKYLEHHKLNKFTINKMISKCRDSFRVSAEDKEMLTKYRVK